MNFSFYNAAADYCEFLRKGDPVVPYTMDKKMRRPFVGIVFTVNGFKYYAPLTSPKPKHKYMKNQIDFLKICGGEWGCINFNNMIPIHDSSLKKVDMKLSQSDAKDVIDYKNLLFNQLSWCNSNKEIILRKAEKLYSIIKSGEARPELVQRCCNFAADEQQYILFCKNSNINLTLLNTKTHPIKEMDNAEAPREDEGWLSVDDVERQLGNEN